MRVSVIICTRNRAASLARTLGSVTAAVETHGPSAQLIVVDNGSSDGTRDLLKRWSSKHPRITIVEELRPGLSTARNVGWRSAAGELLLFTDDDILCGIDWVGRMVDPILTERADAVVGDVVFPRSHLPDWFGPLHRSWFASTERLGSHGPELVGANMCIGRKALEAVGGFDEQLGAGRMGFGEERLVSIRLRQCGYRIQHVADAPVDHWFDLARARRQHLLQTADRMGACEAYISMQTDPGAKGRPGPTLRERAIGRIEAFASILRTAAGVEYATERELHYRFRRTFEQQLRRMRARS